MAHQALDEWLERLKPLIEQTEAPTLMDLSAVFTRTRGDFLGACLEALAEQLDLSLVRAKDYPEEPILEEVHRAVGFLRP